MVMQLTSSAFVDGGKIPIRFTCDGQNFSPPLAWTDVPVETRSFSIICTDPDAPSGTWYHWALFDIPSDIRELKEGTPPAGKAKQAINDFGEQEYGGPCPPRGHGWHHYHFTLYALDMDHIDAPATLKCRQVEKIVKAQALASATLTGVYKR